MRPQIGDAPSHGSKPPPARASLRHASVPRLGATESPLLVVVVAAAGARPSPQRRPQTNGEKSSLRMSRNSYQAYI